MHNNCLGDWSPWGGICEMGVGLMGIEWGNKSYFRTLPKSHISVPWEQQKGEYYHIENTSNNNPKITNITQPFQQHLQQHQHEHH